MRIAILANTLPAALPIYEELKRDSDSEVFIILCPVSPDSALRELFRHCARWILKRARWQSLRLLLEGRVFYFHNTLDHPKSLTRLSKLNLELGLHKSGTIYRESTINCFRLGILNAHIGMLPAYRGRSVMEWAVLEGNELGISVFFIDAGIDTGKRIILSEKVDISHCESLAGAKQYLFSLDAVFYRRALDLVSSGQMHYKQNDLSGRRYYVMSKLFNDVAEKVLSISNQQSATSNR